MASLCRLIHYSFIHETLEAANFSLKMTVSCELCCVALPFCCVALPFSASLEVIVHAIGNTAYVIHTHTALGYSRSSKEDLVAKGIIKKVINIIVNQFFEVGIYKDCFLQVKTVPTETGNTHVESKITRMVYTTCTLNITSANI